MDRSIPHISHHVLTNLLTIGIYVPFAYESMLCLPATSRGLGGYGLTLRRVADCRMIPSCSSLPLALLSHFSHLYPVFSTWLDLGVGVQRELLITFSLDDTLG